MLAAVGAAHPSSSVSVSLACARESSRSLGSSGEESFEAYGPVVRATSIFSKRRSLKPPFWPRLVFPPSPGKAPSTGRVTEDAWM